MRSIFVCTYQSEETRVRLWLDSNLTKSTNDQWILQQDDTAALYVGLNGLNDWENDVYTRLLRRFSGAPLVVVADVSGRIPGHAEARALALSILAAVTEGIVMDDHSDHFWTADEIRSGAQISGRHFFHGG